MFEVLAFAPWDAYLTVLPAAVFAEQIIHLRGTFNGWDESVSFEYQGESRYAVTVELEAGVHEFKVATADWSTVDLGAAPWLDPLVPLAQTKRLEPMGTNLILEVPDPGTYEFVIEGYRLYDLNLTVRQVP